MPVRAALDVVQRGRGKRVDELKLWSDMTPRERDATIHQVVFDKHVEHGRIPCPDGKPGCLVLHFGYTSDGVPVPCYTTDDTACRLLLQEIEQRRLQSAYIPALSQVVGYTWEVGREPSARQAWLMVYATAEQRCHAAVRAMGAEV